VSHCSWENELRSLVDRVSTFIDFDIVGQGSILTFGFCLIYLGGWTTHSAFRDRSWLPVCFHNAVYIYKYVYIYIQYICISSNVCWLNPQIWLVEIHKKTTMRMASATIFSFIVAARHWTLVDMDSTGGHFDPICHMWGAYMYQTYTYIHTYMSQEYMR
jgi:hypothetical protein